MDSEILSTVKRYKGAVMGLKECSAPIKDKMILPFLSYSLSSTDVGVDVVESALETMLILESTMPQMADTFGVIESLDFTSKREDIPSDLRSIAAELHGRLTARRESIAHNTRSKTKTRLRRGQVRCLTFHVHGLHDHTRRDLETTLITIKGVISVVLDVVHMRICVRTQETVTPEEIAAVLYREINMEAKLVTKNKFGKEVLKPLVDSSPSSSDEWPQYLPEEDSPPRENVVSNFRVKEKTTEWLSNVVGFFQKSFYW